MKLKHASVAALAAASLLFSSCVYGPGAGYGTFTYSTNGYDSSVAWTSASYDANGFPIFGYSYGRPVYGYTEAGVAIFTIAALTALCFVPHWNPAPWYHGHWHYPAHIHRCAAPPHFPSGHRPGHRPPGGMNAPIHRNPGSVLTPHGGQRPGNHHMGGQKPGNRPNMGGQKPGNRPSMGGQKPGNRPSMGGQKPGNRPNMGGQAPGNRPNMGGQAPGNRPNMGGQKPGNNLNMGGNRPAVQAPKVNLNHTNNHQTLGGRSAGNRPGMGSRPASSSRPSGGGHHRR